MMKKKVKINLATKSQLNWLIATSRPEVRGASATHVWIDTHAGLDDFLIGEYTTDPVRMQPLIEEFKVSVMHDDEWEVDHSDPEDDGCRWHAFTLQTDESQVGQYEETPLMAAARVLCLQHYGQEAEVPDDLA